MGATVVERGPGVDTFGGLFAGPVPALTVGSGRALAGVALTMAAGWG